MAATNHTGSRSESQSVKSAVTNAIEELVGSEEGDAVRKWINDTELRIVVMGKTGSGKSTLLNNFLGVNVFVEGDSFDPVTENVKVYRHNKNGVNIVVWDCPGLQDGTGKEDQYLQELKTKTDGDIHLMLYCIDMRETRSDLHWGSAIDKITVALGKDIWNHTALVLTFANIYERRFDTEKPKDRKRIFDDRVNEWQEKLQQKLKSIDGVKKSTIESIQVIPAGKDSRKPLCGQKDWMSDLWAEMLKKVRKDVQQTVITLNADRFREPDEVDDEDLDVDLHRQPIILTPNVKKALTAAIGVGGIAAGGGVGAAIGAGVGGLAFGVASMGLAAGIGAGVGAAVGGAVGMIATTLVLLYRKRKEEREYKIPDQKGT